MIGTRMHATAHLETSFADVVNAHLDDHLEAVTALRRELPLLMLWGCELARRLTTGHRLLVVGNGGSAAEAQHFTAELVGRFDGDRPPFPAMALHAETSSVTAIANDYGYEQVFARQVQAHAQDADVVILLSTGEFSPNLVAAAHAARAIGASTWALTGPGPNDLSDASDAALCLSGTPAAVQEAQLLAIHLLCRVFDDRVHALDPRGRAGDDSFDRPTAIGRAAS
ncbi:MAG TPA: SIS domain-containing protein [Microbacterium sp.]|uniref:D-sedoheptulose-7-phosphate isomerase n=1 Tax=Microbacterium sp. TaxID=51671 RepID=UPI002B4706D1|nr:SIS domain-containing protein [Microbacterium sp.]HKT56929.1 SIS domain-containing protein [Microbacterium sp.]